MDDILKQLNEDLKEDWQNLFKSIGVKDADGLEKLEKGGQKDKSKLVPKKIQVMRNGKQVETTVYVRPEDADSIDAREKKAKAQPKKEKKEKTQKPVKTEHQVIAPHDEDELKDLHKQIDKWKDKESAQALKDASKDCYLATIKAGKKVSAVASFKREGDNLEITHFTSTKELKGSGVKIIKEMIKIASEKKLGLTLKPPKGSAKFLKTLGFTDNDFSGKLSIAPNEMKKILNSSAPKEDKKEQKENKDTKKKDA
ncbi:hypothetical protein [Bacillus phage YungSlug]|nr:hypothetical protein [Bacillus phage YungSlug]